MANVTIMSELDITLAAMAQGWVKFSYIKADGTKRVAVGTTNRALAEQMLGRRLHNENLDYYDNCGYFDFAKCAWRQFNRNRFVGLELSRLSNEDAFKIAITLSYADVINTHKVEAREDYKRMLKGASVLVGFAVVEQVNNVVVDMLNDIKFRVSGDGKIADNDINFVIKSWGIVEKQAEQVAAFNKVTAQVSRADLIAELKKLRARESEILEILLK